MLGLFGFCEVVFLVSDHYCIFGRHWLNLNLFVNGCLPHLRACLFLVLLLLPLVEEYILAHFDVFSHLHVFLSILNLPSFPSFSH
jgi:hypothetical protein